MADTMSKRTTNKIGLMISHQNQQALTELQKATNMSFSQIVNKLIEDAQCGTGTSKGKTNGKEI
ncbi:hypothetical protein ACLHZ0_20300 [Aeromonas salmonicida]|jgi:hypothetical protein|uniref:hypothetical protein n=1 Tax=Aeromonas salmonicida TaxID=645 RepID=UPI003D03FA55